MGLYPLDGGTEPQNFIKEGPPLSRRLANQRRAMDSNFRTSRRKTVATVTGKIHGKNGFRCGKTFEKQHFEVSWRSLLNSSRSSCHLEHGWRILSGFYWFFVKITRDQGGITIGLFLFFMCVTSIYDGFYKLRMRAWLSIEINMVKSIQKCTICQCLFVNNGILRICEHRSLSTFCASITWNPMTEHLLLHLWIQWIHYNYKLGKCDIIFIATMNTFL